MSGLIPCKVYKGMFSDERIIEIGQQMYQVLAEDVPEEDESGNGQLKVLISDHNPGIAILPTLRRDMIEINQQSLVHL